MNNLLVGIDVSSRDLQVAMIVSNQLDAVFEGSFTNDLAGATQIKQKILELNTATPFAKVVVGMEATSIYSFHPAYFFKSDSDLQVLNVETVVINPRSTKRYKEIYEDSKTDPIDAFYIADFLRNGRYQTNIVREEEYLALQRLTRSRYEVVHSLARSKQHFFENLYYKVNDLAIKSVDTSIFGSTMMDLLTGDMTLEDIANLPIKDFSAFLNKKGKGRFANPDRLAEAIQKAIRDSYRLNKVMADSVDIVLAVYVNEIKTYQKLIKDLDKAIANVLDTLPEAEILESIPGIGPVYAAGIIAEIGQIDRFSDQTKLAKYAGLAWKRNQSGSFDSRHTPILHTGNTYLRYYLIEATNSVIRYDPVFRKRFDKKNHEIANAPRKRALVLTARKLIRVIYYLLSKHQIYQTKEVV